MNQIKNNLLNNLISNPLAKDFYLRNSIEVARDLIGKYFIKKYKLKFLLGKIVETEAYSGENDQASHSFIGKTNRNKSMFEEGGVLYVYFTYGVHYCANVVTGVKNSGEAVLIRAVEPIAGVDFISMNRYNKINLNKKEFANLSNGPAKFCQGFRIDKKDDGTSLLGERIYISSAELSEKPEILSSKRIGISKSKDLLWRFFIKDNKFVSHTKNQK